MPDIDIEVDELTEALCDPATTSRTDAPEKPLVPVGTILAGEPDPNEGLVDQRRNHLRHERNGRYKPKTKFAMSPKATEALRVKIARDKRKRRRKAGDFRHQESDGTETPNGTPKTLTNPRGAGRTKGALNKRSERLSSRHKYTEEMPDRLLSYFRAELRRVADKSPGQLQRLSFNMPSFRKFAQACNVQAATVLAWETEHEDFGDAAYECRQIQSEILMIMVTLGGWNHTFGLSLLKQLCGWADKTVVDHVGEGAMGTIVYLEPEDRNA